VLGDREFFLGRRLRRGFGRLFGGLGFFFLCDGIGNAEREKQDGTNRTGPRFGVHSQFSP
jgi:hypothetical protein